MKAHFHEVLPMHILKTYRIWIGTELIMNVWEENTSHKFATEMPLNYKNKFEPMSYPRQYG